MFHQVLHMPHEKENNTIQSHGLSQLLPKVLFFCPATVANAPAGACRAATHRMHASGSLPGASDIGCLAIDLAWLRPL